MTDNQKKVILDWMRKVHTLEYAHRSQSIRWENMNLWLGIPPIVLGAMIGVIATIKSGWLLENKELVTSLSGTIVAVLTGLQTFLKPLELAEKHRANSITYEKLRHKFEYLIGFSSLNTATLDLEVSKLREEFENIDAPNVSNSKFIAAKKKVKNFNKYPPELGFLENI